MLWLWPQLHDVSMLKRKAIDDKTGRRRANHGKRRCRNTGDRDGDETAEVYLIPKNVIGGPLLALVGFEKIRLPKGVSKTLQITIDSRQLSFVSASGSRNVWQGDYELFVGGGLPRTGRI